MTRPAVLAAYQRRIGTRTRPVLHDVHHPLTGDREPPTAFQGETVTITLVQNLRLLGFDRVGVRVARGRIADFTVAELLRDS